MPAEAVTDCRRAWTRLEGSPEAVVHGDPGPANIRMSEAASCTCSVPASTASGLLHRRSNPKWRLPY
jgi:hypothetical protein